MGNTLKAHNYVQNSLNSCCKNLTFGVLCEALTIPTRQSIKKKKKKKKKKRLKNYKPYKKIKYQSIDGWQMFIAGKRCKRL